MPHMDTPRGALVYHDDNQALLPRRFVLFSAGGKKRIAAKIDALFSEKLWLWLSLSHSVTVLHSIWHQLQKSFNIIVAERAIDSKIIDSNDEGVCIQSFFLQRALRARLLARSLLPSYFPFLPLPHSPPSLYFLPSLPLHSSCVLDFVFRLEISTLDL